MAREFGAQLQNQALVRVQEANVSAIESGHLLIVAKAELLGTGVDAAVKLEAASTAAAPTADQMQTDVPEVEHAAAKTPAAALKAVSATLAKTSPYATPANHPTPPSAGW